MHKHAALGLVLKVTDDFADTEQPHHQCDEFEPVGEFRHAEGKTRRARIEILSNRSKQKAEDDHGDRLDQ